MCNNNCGCPDPDKIFTDDVIYSGPFLPNIGSSNGNILTDILINIDEKINSSTPNSRIKGGVVTMTGNGIDKTFTFPHTLGILPSGVSANATNANAADNFFITFDATNITINYSIAPSSGDTLTWTFTAVKN